MKKYEIIYEVVKQYKVEIEAENEALAKEMFEVGKFNDDTIQEMEDIAPHEDWNSNKNIVDISQLNYYIK
mgnify:CR=1 FL=1